MHADPPRLILAEDISRAIQRAQVVVVAGARGLGQKATVNAAPPPSHEWESIAVNANWLTGGYLAGFQDLLDLALRWCDQNRPEVLSRYEQSIKRILPKYESPHFLVPKDLTNTSGKDERTRFYHHEYQNKLLVGLSEFLLEYLDITAIPRLLKVDNASSMSPTANSLLRVLLRNPSSAALIRFILIDYERTILLPNAVTVPCPQYSYEDMNELLGLEQSHPSDKAHKIYLSSRGNAMMARAILACDRVVPLVGYLDATATVDLYLATLDDHRRRALVAHYVAQQCESDDYIEIRNYETCNSGFADQEHEQRHTACMAAYERGDSPLITVHAQAIKDKYRRLTALVEPSEILKNIGLYDTLLTYFAAIFADRDLRGRGSGDEASNAVFINAAFVLYSLGCGHVSALYLDEFCQVFPRSKYVPTVLYAQAMTYGRYLQPVDLTKAEQYALANIATIEAHFKECDKYDYIKVFAENAYAYIKARQGKFDEALELCASGNERMLKVYGPYRFRLHQSILIYNTSQVYEIVKDYARAETQLRLAISYDPYYGEYYNDLGNLLSKVAGRAEEALAAYGAAIELCPPYHEAFLNRALLHARLGNPTAALKDLRRVLEIKPGDWRALLEMGNIRLAQGDCEEALRKYCEASAIDPMSADLQCNMGLALSECGDLQASVAHYRTAIDLNPGNAAAHNNLAVELFNMGRREEALRHATIAVDLGGDPDYETNRTLFACSEPLGGR